MRKGPQGLIGGLGFSAAKESEILRVATEDLDECQKTLKQLKISDDYHWGRQTNGVNKTSIKIRRDY